MVCDWLKDGKMKIIKHPETESLRQKLLEQQEKVKDLKNQIEDLNFAIERFNMLEYRRTSDLVWSLLLIKKELGIHGVEAAMNALKKFDEIKKSESEGRDRADDTELNKLYRALAKKLHPDLNDDDNAELFHALADAYKDGDMDTMKIIEQSIAGGVNLCAKDLQLSLLDLKKKCAALKNQLEALRCSETVLEIKKMEKVGMEQYFKERRSALSNEIKTLEKRKNK